MFKEYGSMKIKRRKNNKILKKSDNSNYYNILYYGSINIDDNQYHLVCPPYAKHVRKDNSNAFILKDGGCCDYHRNRIRIPSLKRNVKTWRNFYKLFPRLYLIMRKHVTTQMEGDVINIEYDYNNDIVKVKVKVIDNLKLAYVDRNINKWIATEKEVKYNIFN